MNMATENIYAIDNVQSVEKIFLESKKKSIDFSEYIPKDFKGKFVIHFESFDNPERSLAFKKGCEPRPLFLNLKVSDLNFIIKTKDNNINDFYDENKKYEYTYERNLSIFSVVDIPYVAHQKIPKGKEEYVEMTKVMHFYIVVSDTEFAGFVKNNCFEIYDSFSRLGFVVVDIESFDNFIFARAKNNDLIDLFTTTEIANELFDEGLMILCWGNHPWLYYVNSIKSSNDEVDFGRYTGYSGCYKFKESFKRVSIIPGNELKDWSSCKTKKWPTINLEGEGEYVKLALFVRAALSQSDTNYPIPTFNLQRSLNKELDIKPLLESEIFN